MLPIITEEEVIDFGVNGGHGRGWEKSGNDVNTVLMNEILKKKKNTF